MISLFFALLMMVALTGCAGYIEYMKRSASPGFNVTQTMTRYESTDYEVLGVVMAQGDSRCIMGVFIEGEEGEGLLWDAAKTVFGDQVTGIKDISASHKYQSVLPPVFSEIRTTYIGTAIKEK